MLAPQGFTQQGIVEQVNLADRKIVGGAPVTIKQVEIVAAASAIVCTCLLHVNASGMDHEETQSRSNRSTFAVKSSFGPHARIDRIAKCFLITTLAKLLALKL